MKEFQYLYLCVDLGCLLVPFIFSFHSALRFDKYWRELLVGLFVMMALFIPWDIFFTAKAVWGFHHEFILGTYLAGLPLEEWLFFICIPYACIFTFHCMKFFFPKEPLPVFFRMFTIVIAILFLFTALCNVGKWYTFTAHLLASLFLFLHLFVLKSKYISWFMLTFLIVFPLFIISNGILTGIEFWKYPLLNFHPETILQSVVWYNNDHNLGIRICSMPVDDIAYGMLMLLLVTTVYESRKKVTS